MDITDSLKKVLLAGVGAAALTVEKSTELVDTLVEKGEITVEKGKALNEELKHKVEEKKEEKTEEESKSDVSDFVSKLNDDEINQLREIIAKLEKKDEE